MQSDLGLLILRVLFGLGMLSHGIPKLLSFNQSASQFPDPIGLGPVVSAVLTVFAEVVCSAMILFGFKTRFAALPLVITMAVAAFIVHAPDPLAKKELALLYLAGFAAIGLLGPGRVSVDKN